MQGLAPSKPSDSGSSPNDTIYLCNFRVGAGSKGKCTNKNTPLSTSLKATQYILCLLAPLFLFVLLPLFYISLPFWVYTTQTTHAISQRKGANVDKWTSSFISLFHSCFFTLQCIFLSFSLLCYYWTPCFADKYHGITVG